MLSFIVTWHASGYCGAFRYQVVAGSLENAKEAWEEFVNNNDELNYSWEKAKNAVKRHHGGYIAWKQRGTTDKPAGCYELEFDSWGGQTDHVRD